jgi:hypothetical protein
LEAQVNREYIFRYNPRRRWSMQPMDIQQLTNQP